MANTYTQLYVHIVFSVYSREPLISEANREEVERYISGIVANHKCKLLAIYCKSDHTHILIGLHTTISLSDLVREIKSSSSRFINSKGWTRGRFNWQDGFGAFSYGRSQLDSVVKYILNQPVHHQTTSFESEYVETLKKFGVEYDEQYVFD